MTCGNIVTQSLLRGYIKQAFKRVGEYVVQWLWWGPHLLGDCWWSLDWFTRIAFSLAAGYGYGMLTLAAWGHVVVMGVLLVGWTVGLSAVALWRGWQAHVLVWQGMMETPQEDEEVAGVFGPVESGEREVGE